MINYLIDNRNNLAKIKVAIGKKKFKLKSPRNALIVGIIDINNENLLSNADNKTYL